MPSSAELVDFIRGCAVALCRASEPVSRIPDRMSALCAAYGVTAEFFVLPTGVFVRLGGSPTATLDFAPVTGPDLRLDQLTSLYDLLADATAGRVTPAEGNTRLASLLRAPARFGRSLTVLGYTVMTVGLGLMLDGDRRALPVWIVVGAFVGVLRAVAVRVRSLSLVLPIAAAMLVTALSYRLGPHLTGASPAALVIPPLVVFLPGGMLTQGALELVTGAMIAGASRLISGIYVLLLLAFGVLAGLQLAGNTHPVPPASAPLGWWAPWVGVLVFGLGLYLHSSARSLGWLLLVLYAAWIGQFIGGILVGGLFSAFCGGLVIMPVSYLVRRWHGPPAQVSFLPAFWLLVPGAIGLTGVSELVAAGSAHGLNDLVTALLTIVAVAIGVLVGSSLTDNLLAGRGPVASLLR